MNPLATIASLLLAGTQPPSVAHDRSIVDLVWERDAAGSFFFAHPWLDGYQARRALFGPALLGGDRSLVELPTAVLPHLLMNCLLLGTGDGVARIDARRHFARLRRGMSATDLRSALAAPSDGAEVAWHTALDRQIAINLSGLLGYRSVAPVLERIAGSAAGSNPDEARSARRSIAALNPHLDTVLAHVPANQDILITALPALLPDHEPVTRAWQDSGLTAAEDYILANGASASPAALVEAQILLELPGLLPYELARRFGNWRIACLGVGFRKRERWNVWGIAVGTFDPARFHSGVEQETPIEARAIPGGYRYVLANGWRLSITNDRLEFADSDTARATSDELATLRAHGFSEVAAMRAYVRDPGRWLDPCKGIQAITACLQRAHDVAIAFEFETADHASAWAGEWPETSQHLCRCVANGWDDGATQLLRRLLSLTSPHVVGSSVSLVVPVLINPQDILTLLTAALGST